jgi:hypothetical protein
MTWLTISEAQKMGIDVALFEPSDQQPAGPSKVVEPAQSNVASQLHQRSKEFIATLYRTTSGPTNEANAALNNIYADTVTYFGKESSREQVITQVQLFLARWPIRQYKPKEGTVKIDCDEVALTCAVTGVMQFDAQSPLRNERSTGEATFEYHLRFSSSYQQMPKITAEAGTVLKKSLQALSPENNGSPSNTPDGYSPLGVTPGNYAISENISNGILNMRSGPGQPLSSRSQPARAE